MVELKFVPDNRNYFQVDGKELHDAPTPAVSVRCPHCRELGSFEVVRKNAFRYSKHGKMTHDALVACLGLEIGISPQKVSDFHLDGLREQGMRSVAQNLSERIGEGPWLSQLDDVSVGHGVSLLWWRSGGVEHPHDTPPYPFMPSPTSAHSS